MNANDKYVEVVKKRGNAGDFVYMECNKRDNVNNNYEEVVNKSRYANDMHVEIVNN